MKPLVACLLLVALSGHVLAADTVIFTKPERPAPADATPAQIQQANAGGAQTTTTTTTTTQQAPAIQQSVPTVASMPLVAVEVEPRGPFRRFMQRVRGEREYAFVPAASVQSAAVVTTVVPQAIVVPQPVILQSIRVRPQRVRVRSSCGLFRSSGCY